MSEKIGLIAGNRRFPCIFAQQARRQGHSVVAVGVKGDTAPQVKKFVDKLYWLSLSQYSRLFEIFKAEGVKKVVMAGQISPRRLFSRELEKDKALSGLLSGIKDKRADSVFGAIAAKLNEQGLELISSTTFLEDYLPAKGVLSAKEPDFKVWEDVYFGFEAAKALGALDIGQAVAVKNHALAAVEALEGTDNLIKRASRLCGRGLVIVKVAKPKQDARFDVPVVGLNTVKNLIRAKAACLAIEAGKTLFIDKEIALKLADRKGLAVAAV